MRQNWPERLPLVRHGQSEGNVARDAADEAGSHEIDIDVRDVDVPLQRSDGGRQSGPVDGPALPREDRPEPILHRPTSVRKRLPRLSTARALLPAGRPRRSSTSACVNASPESSTA